MSETPQFSHHHTHDIVCPWCGTLHPDSESLSGNQHSYASETCGKCGKCYGWECYPIIVYYTRRIESDSVNLSVKRYIPPPPSEPQPKEPPCVKS